MRRVWLGAVVVLALCGTAGAQSFDCKLARSAVEKAVCASPELSRLDGAMGAKYRQELGEVPSEMQLELRQFQRNWLRGLAVRCKANAAQMSLTTCLVAEYKGQMDALDQQVMQRAGVTFVVRHIEVLAKDDGDDPWKDDQDGLAQTPGYGTLDASWPQALSSEPQWAAWNAAVLAETQQMAGGGADQGHGWQKEWAAGTDSTVTARLVAVGPQVVSVAITNEVNGHGAAHPSESYETFHWMLAERRPVKASDVFAAGTGWEAVLTAACRASLKQQAGADYAAYAGGGGAFAQALHAVVSDPKNWDLDAKGLTVSFPEYSVTPRAEPVDGVLVPWSALRADLAKGYVVPK